LNIGTKRKARASLKMAGEYPFREGLHFIVTTVYRRKAQGFMAQEGRSQRKLAEAASMSQRAIVDLETDRREPHPSTLEKLAEALSVEPAELLED
jgi:DNA-binding Xre family transcriptional regulator